MEMILQCVIYTLTGISSKNKNEVVFFKRRVHFLKVIENLTKFFILLFY